MKIVEVILDDGTEIWASAIHGQATYAHVYEGLPTTESNKGYLAHFPQRIERIFHGPFPVHVVEPDRRKTGEKFMGREVEYLPPVWFAAEFYKGAMDTCLAVVWFQHDPYPIPSDSVRRQLASVNWAEHAEPFEA